MSVHIALDRLPRLIQEFIVPANPELGAALIEVLDSVAKGSEVDDAHLARVVEVASGKRESHYVVGISLLGKLAETDQRAVDQILAMTRAKRGEVRHNAVLCLNEATPESVARAVLAAALSDKSSLVRRKAADWAGRLELKLATPFLQRASEIEQHQQTRGLMLIELGILRDGYFLRDASPSSVYVTVQAERQGRFNELVEKSDLYRLGIHSVVKRLRNLD